MRDDVSLNLGEVCKTEEYVREVAGEVGEKESSALGEERGAK